MKLYPLVLTATTFALSLPALATPVIQLHQAELKTEYTVEYLPYNTLPNQPSTINIAGSSTSGNPYASLSSNYSEQVYIRDDASVMAVSAYARIDAQKYELNGAGSPSALNYSLETNARNGFPIDSISENQPMTPREQALVNNGYQDLYSINSVATVFLDFTVYNDNSSFTYTDSGNVGNNENYYIELFDVTNKSVVDYSGAYYGEFALQENHRYTISAYLTDFRKNNDDETDVQFSIKGNLNTTSVDAPSSLALLMGSLFCLIGLRKRRLKQA